MMNRVLKAITAGLVEYTSQDGINDDQKLVALVQLHSRYHEQRNKRRDFEWKFSFIIWTPLALLIGFALTKELKGSIGPPWVVIGAHVILFLTYVFVWLHNLQKRNFQDLRRACTYEKEIHRLLGMTYQEPAGKKGIFLLLDWAALTQIIITTLLLATSLSCLLNAP